MPDKANTGEIYNGMPAGELPDLQWRLAGDKAGGDYCQHSFC